MPALHTSPESRASSFSLFRYPIPTILAHERGCETGRQRPPHRVHIQHSLSNLSSTTPIYPTCQSRPSRHRQSLSLNPPHLSLARSLFLRALSSGRPLVTVVPCYVMSRLVHPVSPRVFPWTTGNPSKSFKRSPRCYLPDTLSPRLRGLHIHVSTTCHQHCICTNPSHPPPALSSKQSALSKPENHVAHAVLSVMLGAALDTPHPSISAIASAHLAITTASLLFLAIGAASSLHLSCTSPNARLT
ncbi:hypothetical protein Q7P36_000321 [Cladosporium allicinum]